MAVLVSRLVEALRWPEAAVEGAVGPTTGTQHKIRSQPLHQSKTDRDRNPDSHL